MELLLNIIILIEIFVAGYLIHRLVYKKGLLETVPMGSYTILRDELDEAKSRIGELEETKKEHLAEIDRLTSALSGTVEAPEKQWLESGTLPFNPLTGEYPPLPTPSEIENEPVNYEPPDDDRPGKDNIP
ncbi:MAG: hypothetical protein U1D67_10030 [Dehalococcoidia bacterium]|nr:hypothetical protein [Dehalococcoidia bacterium]MDZ4247441.1 hypothetical protein [Dehalococcoidia bacterium]